MMTLLNNSWATQLSSIVLMTSLGFLSQMTHATSISTSTFTLSGNKPSIKALAILSTGTLGEAMFELTILSLG